MVGVPCTKGREQWSSKGSRICKGSGEPSEFKGQRRTQRTLWLELGEGAVVRA